MSIPFSEIQIAPEPLYTFADPDTGKAMTFAVRRMTESLKVKMIPEVIISIDYEAAVNILGDPGRVNTVQLRALMSKKHLDPVLTIRFPSGKDVLVEGEMRYCAAAARKQTEIFARRVPLSVAQDFLVTGVPLTQDQLNAIAGQAPLQTKH